MQIYTYMYNCIYKPDIIFNLNNNKSLHLKFCDLVN